MNSVSPRIGNVIVSGMMFWYPLAAVTNQILHYLIGLRAEKVLGSLMGRAGLSGYAMTAPRLTVVVLGIDPIGG